VTERINMDLSIANLAELTAGHCRANAPYKVPADFIDKLPRTATGKALKHELGNRWVFDHWFPKAARSLCG
jgi:acyl-coenzyme A synthetase/AMP-(fatty) acid ligase